MQDPLDISNYTDLDLEEFRVRWPPKLVAAIRDCAQEEERMAPIWEQQRLEQLRRRQEEQEANLRDYHLAKENFVRTSQEVEEWLHRQRESQN